MGFGGDQLKKLSTCIIEMKSNSLPNSEGSGILATFIPLRDDSILSISFLNLSVLDLYTLAYFARSTESSSIHLSTKLTLFFPECLLVLIGHAVRFRFGKRH